MLGSMVSGDGHARNNCIDRAVVTRWLTGPDNRARDSNSPKDLLIGTLIMFFILSYLDTLRLMVIPLCLFVDMNRHFLHKSSSSGKIRR